MNEENNFSRHSMSLDPVPEVESATENTDIPAGGEEMDPVSSAPAPVVILTDEPVIVPHSASWGQKLLLFLVAGLIIFADQFTKRLVEQNIPLGTSVVPFEGLADLFQFTHTTNTGAAFGLFPDGGTLFAIVAVVVAIVIVIYGWRLPAGHLFLRVALGLQLGGALGNLIDRARLGHVTDFIDVGPVPIFNIADAAVVTGVALMALIIFLESRQEQQAARVTKGEVERTPAHQESSSVPRTFTTVPTQSSDEPGTN